jgi:DNA (cytosine-5)-methyltransferase 1
MNPANILTFYEFFAGGGMARAGLGSNWRCLFANDFDPKKVEAYRENWGDGEIRLGDIHAIDTAKLPGAPDLAWGSFPCQDLSLAGNGAGLNGARSEAFWGYHRIISGLRMEGRAPRVLVLENVVGAITSNGGRDFEEIFRSLNAIGYVFGALTMDARHFLPQSRPRLFIVAVRNDVGLSPDLFSERPVATWASSALVKAQASLRPDLRRSWRWWNVAAPSASNSSLLDVVEADPADVEWHSLAETRRFLEMMSDANRAKVEKARKSGKRIVGAIYRRTRSHEGAKVQRAEVRFDDVAGCLRTPGGGSSRQFIMLVEGESVRTRLLSGREAARLMGLPDEYKLPANYNEAYHLMGDGLAVPVVRHLAENLLARLVQPSPVYAVAAE